MTEPGASPGAGPARSADDEPRLTVTKMSYWQPVAVDADGTPLHHGERMTEVEPGVWADPLFVAVMDLLEQGGGEP